MRSNRVGGAKKDDMLWRVVFFDLRAVNGAPPQGRFDMLGRSESALRQGFASQNACDAALAAKDIALGSHRKTGKPLLRLVGFGVYASFFV